jgi:hypothetical protein
MDYHGDSPCLWSVPRTYASVQPKSWSRIFLGGFTGYWPEIPGEPSYFKARML